MLKYSPQGERLWDTEIPGQATGDTQFYYTVLADAQGDVILAAVIAGRASAVKLSAAGEPLWTREIRRAGDAPGEAHAALDREGNVLAVSGPAVVKYSPDGTEVWSREITAQGVRDIRSWSVAEAADGNTYVTGFWSVPGEGVRRAFVVKYDESGDELWLRPYQSPEHGGGAGWQVIPAPDGNLLVGMSQERGINEDFHVAKLDAAGEVLWSACRVWSELSPRHEYKRRL